MKSLLTSAVVAATLTMASAPASAIHTAATGGLSSAYSWSDIKDIWDRLSGNYTDPYSASVSSKYSSTGQATTDKENFADYQKD